MSFQDLELYRVYTHILLQSQSASESEAVCTSLRCIGLVRQGLVYGIAVHFIRYCLSYIESQDVTDFCMGDALDIILEIVLGEPDPSEIALGNTLVVKECQDIVRCYSGLLCKLAESNDEFVVYGALELLWELEPDNRLLVQLAREAEQRELRQRSAWTHDGFLRLLAQILKNSGRT